MELWYNWIQLVQPHHSVTNADGAAGAGASRNPAADRKSPPPVKVVSAAAVNTRRRHDPPMRFTSHPTSATGAFFLFLYGGGGSGSTPFPFPPPPPKPPGDSQVCPAAPAPASDCLPIEGYVEGYVVYIVVVDKGLTPCSHVFA